MEYNANPNTIQKAYQELERLGYIYTVKGRGNYVSPSSEWKNDRKDEYLEEPEDDYMEESLKEENTEE